MASAPSINKISYNVENPPPILREVVVQPRKSLKNRKNRKASRKASRMVYRKASRKACRKNMRKSLKNRKASRKH